MNINTTQQDKAIDSPVAFPLSAWGRGLSTLGSCLMVLLIAFVAGGATCSRRQKLAEFTPPIVFEAAPSLAEVSAQVNRSLKIQRLESNTMSITSPDMMAKLSGSLAWERPHNFNLQAYPLGGTRLMGLAFAAGSNADMFWLQQQMPSPPTLYYARHDDFNNQTGPRVVLPVSPLWLREALGVVELDPALQHNGPRVRPDSKLEIESFIPSPRGAYRRVIVLDAKTGTIEQTFLYDAVNKLVAVAQQSEHQYYSAIDWSLPHKVDISLLPDEGEKIEFTVEVEFYMLNEASSSDPTSFTPPDPTGLSTYNLARPANGQAAAATPPVYTQTNASVPQSGFDNYRVVR